MILLLYLQISLIYCDLSTNMLKLTNLYRRMHNLNDLEDIEPMRLASALQANTMCKEMKLTHTNSLPNRLTVRDRLMFFNFTGVNIGENIAKQQNSDFKEVFKVWIKSKLHRKNILGDYTYTHVATCKDINNNTYWVQVFGKGYINWVGSKYNVNKYIQDNETKLGDAELDTEKNGGVNKQIGTMEASNGMEDTSNDVSSGIKDASNPMSNMRQPDSQMHINENDDQQKTRKNDSGVKNEKNNKQKDHRNNEQNVKPTASVIERKTSVRSQDINNLSENTTHTISRNKATKSYPNLLYADLMQEPVVDTTNQNYTNRTSNDDMMFLVKQNEDIQKVLTDVPTGYKLLYKGLYKKYIAYDSTGEKPNAMNNDKQSTMSNDKISTQIHDAGPKTSKSSTSNKTVSATSLIKYVGTLGSTSTNANTRSSTTHTTLASQQPANINQNNTSTQYAQIIEELIAKLNGLRKDDKLDISVNPITTISKDFTTPNKGIETKGVSTSTGVNSPSMTSSCIYDHIVTSKVTNTKLPGKSSSSTHATRNTSSISAHSNSINSTAAVPASTSMLSSSTTVNNESDNTVMNNDTASHKDALSQSTSNRSMTKVQSNIDEPSHTNTSTAVPVLTTTLFKTIYTYKTVQKDKEAGQQYKTITLSYKNKSPAIEEKDITMTVDINNTNRCGDNSDKSNKLLKILDLINDGRSEGEDNKIDALVSKINETSRNVDIGEPVYLEANT